MVVGADARVPGVVVTTGTAVSPRAKGGVPFRHAAYLLASGSTQAAVAFGSNLILVRHIAPEGFGHFALTLASLTLVYAFGSLRPGQLVIREKHSDAGERRAFLWSACVNETLLLAVVSAIALAAFGADGFGWALWIGVALAHFASQARGFLERKQAYGPLSVIESGSHLVAHGAAIVAVLWGAGIWALAIREVLLAGLQIGALAAVGGLPKERLRVVRPSEWKGLARDAKDLWTDGLLEGLFARAVVLIAGAIAGVRGAGLFFQARRLAQVPHQFLQPVAGRLAFNRFARAADDDAERARQRRTMLVLLLPPLVLAAAGCVFLARPVVPWLLGEEWTDAAPLLASLAGVAGGTSLLAMVKMELLATGRFKKLLALRVAQFAGLGAVPLLLVWWPQLGVEALGVGLGAGIALALLVSRRR